MTAPRAASKPPTTVTITEVRLNRFARSSSGENLDKEIGDDPPGVPFRDSFEEPSPQVNAGGGEKTSAKSGPSYHPYLAGYRRRMRHAAFVDQVMTSEEDESGEEPEGDGADGF